MQGTFFIAAVSLLLLTCSLAFSQSRTEPGFAVNAKLTGLVFHPFGVQGFDLKHALDKDGLLVLQIGGQLDGDWYFHPLWNVRLGAALYKDCAGLWAGYYHLGPRFNWPMDSRFVFRIGIGPTIIWRENWAVEFERYGGNIFYGDRNEAGKYETAFVWYGGDIDFEWKIGSRCSILYSMIPGLPSVVVNNIGIRRYF